MHFPTVFFTSSYYARRVRAPCQDNSAVQRARVLETTKLFLQEGGNTMAQKTDDQITQDILAELVWDPAVTVADLTVSSKQGQVVLNGTADTYGTKLEAEEATYRVGGVKFVDNEIAVNPAALGIRPDTNIAADIRSALVLDYQVPDDRISVLVVNGYVTLTGNVDWYYQKDAAEDDAAMILGVQGLDDEIAVNQPGASAAAISSGIALAFARNAELYDDDIEVTTDGDHVTLSGTVATWSEFDMAEEIVWMSPGVSKVTNNIAVLFS
jgi:osmotically-inducible protein OsmY